MLGVGRRGVATGQRQSEGQEAGRAHTVRVRLGSVDLIAHAGHAVYDHPAMAAIAVAAMVIPMGVLVVLGRVFWRASKNDPDRKD
jgi:2-keto-4-pentenoate hydratase